MSIGHVFSMPNVTSKHIVYVLPCYKTCSGNMLAAMIMLAVQLFLLVSSRENHIQETPSSLSLALPRIKCLSLLLQIQVRWEA